MLSTTIYKWMKLDKAIEARILSVLKSWEGTPFMAGQRARRMGVDCVQLVGGVMDDLYRHATPMLIPRMKQDAGVHSDAGFKQAHAIRKALHSIVVEDDTIEPGDVLVCRSTPDSNAPVRLGHCLLAGVRPNTALHACPTGVCFTSLSGIYPIMRIYRPLNKERWI